jgi:hypothetical protein
MKTNQKLSAIKTLKISLNREIWVSDLIVCPTMPCNYSRFNRSLPIKGKILWKKRQD